MYINWPKYENHLVQSVHHGIREGLLSLGMYNISPSSLYIAMKLNESGEFLSFLKILSIINYLFFILRHADSLTAEVENKLQANIPEDAIAIGEDDQGVALMSKYRKNYIYTTYTRG